MEKDTVNKKRDFGQKLQDFMASYRGKVIMNFFQQMTGMSHKLDFMF